MSAGLQDPEALSPDGWWGYEAVPVFAHEPAALGWDEGGVPGGPFFQALGDLLRCRVAEPIWRIGDYCVHRLIWQGP